MKRERKNEIQNFRRMNKRGRLIDKGQFLFSLNGICVGSEQGQSQNLQYAIYGQDVGVAINPQRTRNRFYMRGQS